MDKALFIKKFDGISIEDESPISNCDAEFCERTQEEYDTAREQLLKFKKIFEDLIKQEKSNDAFSIENGEICENFDSSWNARLMFSLLYPMATIEKKLSDLNSEFIKRIANYFEKGYHIETQYLFHEISKEASKKLSYKEIVDQILNSLDGTSLFEKGSELIKISFRDCLRWKENVSVFKEKISFQNLIHIEIDFNGKSSISYSSREHSYQTFMDSLCLFEDKALKPLIKVVTFLPGCNSREINLNSDYPFPLCKRIQKVRFFKNGRIDLYFPIPELVNEFYELFELSRLESKENRWRR